jgi:predicted ArsR family transcriptional regulator
MAEYGDDDHTAKAGSTVQSVDRAVALLLALAEFSQGASLSELSAVTGLHKSTARRLLVTLSAKALVRRTTTPSERGCPPWARPPSAICCSAR